MWAYPFGFLRAIFGHGVVWWFTLFFAYFMGTGFFSDYQKAREQIQHWCPGIKMPEEFPFWWVAIPFLVWVIFRIAHDEGMRHLQRARIIFERPYIENDIPLYTHRTAPRTIETNGSKMNVMVRESELIARNDMAKIVIRNCPYDYDNGRAIEDAYVSVAFYSNESHELILEFDFPRWSENPAPGYEGNPSDHFPDAWNYRTLRPNRTRNTIDFAIKSLEEENAFGFRGHSQQLMRWRNEKLKIPKGTYLVKISVFGLGIRNPPKSTWIFFDNPGAGGAINVCATKERVTTRWFNGFA